MLLTGNYQFQKKELISEDEIEYTPNLSTTSDATALSVTSNIDQSPFCSNSSIADKKAVK